MAGDVTLDAGRCLSQERALRDRTAGGAQALRADQMLLKGGGAPRKMSWEEEGTIFEGGWTSGFWSD